MCFKCRYVWKCECTFEWVDLFCKSATEQQQQQGQGCRDSQIMEHKRPHCCSTKCCQEDLDKRNAALSTHEQSWGVPPGGKWSDRAGHLTGTRSTGAAYKNDPMAQAEGRLKSLKKGLQTQAERHFRICVPNFAQGMGFTNERRRAQGTRARQPHPLHVSLPPGYGSVDQSSRTADELDRYEQSVSARYDWALYEYQAARTELLRIRIESSPSEVVGSGGYTDTQKQEREMREARLQVEIERCVNAAEVYRRQLRKEQVGDVVDEVPLHRTAIGLERKKWPWLEEGPAAIRLVPAVASYGFKEPAKVAGNSDNDSRGRSPSVPGSSAAEKPRLTYKEERDLTSFFQQMVLGVSGLPSDFEYGERQLKILRSHLETLQLPNPNPRFNTLDFVRFKRSFSDLWFPMADLQWRFRTAGLYRIVEPAERDRLQSIRSQIQQWLEYYLINLNNWEASHERTDREKNHIVYLESDEMAFLLALAAQEEVYTHGDPEGRSPSTSSDLSGTSDTGSPMRVTSPEGRERSPSRRALSQRPPRMPSSLQNESTNRDPERTPTPAHPKNKGKGRAVD